MIKVALLATLLVCLTAAGSAYARPSAPLSITVVPAAPPTQGCAPITGDAARDAGIAGFNTCAFFSDWAAFTGANWVPKSFSGPVATTSNWLNCNPGTDTNAVWNSPGYGTPCPTQVTDTGGGGNLALDLHYNRAQMVDGCIYCDFDELVTAAWGVANPQNPNSHSFSNGYFEITYRIDANFQGSQQAWWSWTCCGTGNTFVEQDFLEDWSTGGAAVDAAFDWWANGIGQGFGNVSPHYPSHDATTYHTLGMLVTGNLSNFADCTYYDGARVGCSNQNYTSGQDGTQRRMLWIENGVSCNHTPGSIVCVDPNFTDSHMYVKSVKAITCAAEPTGGSCLGANYNGNFYTP